MALQSCAKQHQHSNVWHSAIWQEMISHDLLPILEVLSPNYYNCKTHKVAITAPYFPDSNQSDFSTLIPAMRCIPTELTIITGSVHFHQPPNMMTEIPPFSTTNGMPTDPLQQDWYYASKYQQEHLQTNLLPFHWYIGLHIAST